MKLVVTCYNLTFDEYNGSFLKINLSNSIQKYTNYQFLTVKSRRYSLYKNPEDSRKPSKKLARTRRFYEPEERGINLRNLGTGLAMSLLVVDATRRYVHFGLSPQSTLTTNDAEHPTIQCNNDDAPRRGALAPPDAQICAEIVCTSRARKLAGEH